MHMNGAGVVGGGGWGQRGELESWASGRAWILSQTASDPLISLRGAVIPFWQMETVKLSDVQGLTTGHTARKRQGRAQCP